MSQLTVMPIGGVGETGALNSMLYEANETAVLVDCGVAFAGPALPGVNVVVPDFRDLDPYYEKLKALVLTHGHEDHVGAVVSLRRHFDVPIYATPFTMGIVRQKLSLAGLPLSDLRVVEAGKKFTIGEFSIETVFVNHSIMDCVGLLIEGGGQRALHLTDFKIDHAAPEGRTTDLARLKKIGEEGLDVLLLDSTNVFSPGWTESETRVRSGLMEHFTKVKGRILACLFSSNMFRVQSLIECARVTGRKVAFTGRSTKEYSRIARELERLNLDGVELCDVEEVTKYPDGEILVLVTGSQAEPRSVLQRMSQGMFKPFKLREGDTLLMSSKMIPGNEGKILEMLDRVSQFGVEIITEGAELPIHASGHAKEDELREVMRLTRPRWFLPIHGEHRHLLKHSEIAASEGIAHERSILIRDGDRVSFSASGFEKGDSIKIGRVLMHEEDGEIGMDAVRRRRKIAHSGLVAVGVIYDRLRGVVMSDVSLDLSGMLGAEIEASTIDDLRKRLEDALSESASMDRDKVAQFVKIEVRHFYRERRRLKPEVMVLINEM